MRSGFGGLAMEDRGRSLVGEKDWDAKIWNSRLSQLEVNGKER